MSKIIIGVVAVLLILGVLWLLLGGGSLRNLFGQKGSPQPSSTGSAGASPVSSAQPAVQNNNIQIQVPVPSNVPSALPSVSPSASPSASVVR